MSFQGKCVKKVTMAAVKLKLISASDVLLAVKTGKSRSVVSINKETLAIEKTHKLGNMLPWQLKITECSIM